MIIRPETPADEAAIRAVHLAAFDGPAEAAIVDQVRATDRFVPTLSLVAAFDDGRIVGHALVSRADVCRDDGAIAGSVLALGPMAVAPDVQGRGIGSDLMAALVSAANAAGEPLIVVLGHPWFYPAFGFLSAREAGLEPPADWPDAAWMVRRLDAYDPALRGRVVYAPAFGVA